MPSRRDALRILAAGAALPVIPRAAEAAPKFFTKDELTVLARLVDLIIPRTDTPGAADASVHILIDQDASEGRESARILREGIAKIGGTKFLSLSPEKQAATLEGMQNSPFFKTLKSATIEYYYHTREGLVQELGYQGNVALPSFPGCTHPEHQRSDS